MGKLSGKTAIITGASAGFGCGTAYAFAREGCNLGVCTQTSNCHVAELRLAANNCVY